MNSPVVVVRTRGPRLAARASVCTLVLLCACLSSALAAPLAKVQGRILAAENGEPIGFAEVALLPADTSMRRVGGLTNSDGTFLLEAAPGRYAVQIRALSYARKRFDGVVLEAGRVLPLSAALTSEAIRQQEVVVEGRLRQNTENATLTARRKAAALSDAVSAEQVRRTPDKDAAEVLRRVTGLSVADGKYVYVRGLGERYSSTEVDGVRIASPEQNKRVVPLDLFPANLLDRIVVQKTYTADRPGEFGGGDIQVHTRDFPGGRAWRFSIAQGFAEGVTSRDGLMYNSGGRDIFGFRKDAGGIPQAVRDVAGDRPLIDYPLETLAKVGKSFPNVWSARSQRTLPNGSYSAMYGDEFRLFGRALGVIQSWGLTRSFDHEDAASRRLDSATDTLYDYAAARYTQSAQLGGVSALSYRLSPRHTLHVRGIYTKSADDEVLTYQGPDHNQIDPFTGTFLNHRVTRLMYVERTVVSGALEGKHEFSHLLGAQLDWRLSRSEARREQPDRRETAYDRLYSPGPGGTLVPEWIFVGSASREYGDLRDRGLGAAVAATLPYRLGALGKGKLAFGYNYDGKRRTNSYRRFSMYATYLSDWSGTPEAVFDTSTFTGNRGTAYVSETTEKVDNYRAKQFVRAGYVSADVPFGPRLRGTFGVRVERSIQEIESYDLLYPTILTQYGRLDGTDWLPTANLTLAMTDAANLRLGASRTVSRPDLNELSSSYSIEYRGGYQVLGNPNLQRAQIDNYDVRVEAFPGLSEVLAMGVFYKYLREPIEQVLQGGSPNMLIPRNSAYGRNTGLELEARTALKRFWRRLNGLTINTNATIITSKVRLKARATELGTNEHPLQGQASYLVNAALAYTSPGGRLDGTILLGITGKRLTHLSESPLGDVYEQPSAHLDATMMLAALPGVGVKFAARNLLDPKLRQMHGNLEESAWRRGRSYSVSFSYPS